MPFPMQSHAGDRCVKWHAEPDRTETRRASAQGGADPVMLRAYCEDHKGATAFFRNRPLLDTVIAYLASKCPARCRVLFHACSIGAEPFSLAAWWLLRFGGTQANRLQITATDIEPGFVEIGKRAVYPAAVLDGMVGREKALFSPHQQGVQVSSQVREMVRFQPPMSFLDGDPGGDYDAVFVMNALTYVTPDEQTRSIQRISQYCRHLMGLTAFHPDTIEADLTSVGFAPLAANRERIHNAWGDRLTDAPLSPGTPEYSWKLPSFNPAAPSAKWRFSSLFERRENAVVAATGIRR